MDCEVDVQLFITCRLCLEESGSYQIVPYIKGQIKYCFDIDIEPFDGLPQLICKKCKFILNEYYKTKNTIQEKQQKLRLKLKNGRELPVDVIEKEAVVVDHIPDATATGATAVSATAAGATAVSATAVSAPVVGATAAGATADSATAVSAPAVGATAVGATAVTVSAASATAASAATAGAAAAGTTDAGTTAASAATAGATAVRATVAGTTGSGAATVTANNGHANSTKSPAPVGAASHCTSAKSAGTKGNSKKRRVSWKKKFNEHFVCNICNKNYLIKKAVEKHMKKHKKIMKKYSNVFRTYVTIPLKKLDAKKTGEIQYVVYDKVKVINPPINSSYYSYYLKKGLKYNEANIHENEKIEEPAKKVSDKRKASCDSSDSDIIKAKKRNSLRICSISSIETVILEENKDVRNTAGGMPNTDQQGMRDATDAATDCIILDDTSSECPARPPTELETKQVMLQQEVKAEVGDYKAIQSIVTMCHKNYIKKLHSETNAVNSTSSHSESSLKHKVLSIGRKVINKQGFSCTGILRYMEHKDLDITWTPTAHSMQNKAYNFVRIMTKLKSRDESECEDAGWNNLYDTFDCRDSGHDEDILRAENEPKTSDTKASSQTDYTDQSINSATESDLNNKNKLLNKTPVANPKQLPKGKPMPVNDAAIVPSPGVCKSEDEPINDEPMCLPIITSTTSLSNIAETVKPSDPPTEKPAPRIKVKPASELMSERALSNKEGADDIWAFNMCQSSLPLQLEDAAYDAPPVAESQSGYVSSQASGNLTPIESQNHTQTLVDKNHIRDVNDRNEYVILNSSELPNTKTKSPFHYFKRVLLVHGLKLLDLNADLQMHPKFECLVRFKLMMKQDSKSPIGVYLSLFCDKNSFCFMFKDANLKYFDPNQLPAYWQWELLKIYKGDVVRKILQNAAKIGKEVEEFTKHFLCLLQSINLVTEC